MKREELRLHAHKHCIPKRELEAVSYPKIYAWVLKDACRYKRPLKYEHPQGAVTWVKPHSWFTRSVRKRNTTEEERAALEWKVAVAGA